MTKYCIIYCVLMKLLLYVGLEVGSNLPFVLAFIWLFLHRLSKSLSTMLPRSLRITLVGQLPLCNRKIEEFSPKSDVFFFFFLSFLRWSRLSRDVRTLLYKIRAGFYCFTCVSSPLQSSYVETILTSLSR